ncbi:hypothetical protein BCON_0088g00210 [Botryotinia convoluta]|uniref:Uncharacterized protein n=1 Tax=Botryotinia convoluta TaxID=54673 RepID=A0A4Z1I9Z0_9HELO|nr:hypothetical protein BCON_0088g00210 [Botryotinia convoluta]
MSGGTMMMGSANLSPWLKNDTVVELHKKMAFLTFEKLVDSGDGPTLETDHLRNIAQANQIKTSCWLGHLSVEEIVDLLKGIIQEGWYEKKLEVLKDLQPDWFMPATLKDTGKTEEVVNAIEKNEGEASLLHQSFGLTEEKNVDAGEATKNTGKNGQCSTSAQELVAQNQGPARLFLNQKIPHGSGGSYFIASQGERGRAARPDPSRKRRRNTPSPERVTQRRRTTNLGGSYQAHNRFGINTGGDYEWNRPLRNINTLVFIAYHGHEMVHFFNFDIQQQILDDTHHCILRSLYDWAQRYGYGKLFCALLWYKAGHAELQEFHKVLRSVHINEAHLNLFGSSVKEFKEMLCRIAQIRHCAVHHEVDAPLLIIKEMVYDCIELTIMLRDRKATELMETIWDDTLEEISYNSNNRTRHEELDDKLRRTNKNMKKNAAAYRTMSWERQDIYRQLGDMLPR